MRSVLMALFVLFGLSAEAEVKVMTDCMVKAINSAAEVHLKKGKNPDLSSFKIRYSAYGFDNETNESLSTWTVILADEHGGGGEYHSYEVIIRSQSPVNDASCSIDSIKEFAGKKIESIPVVITD